MMAARARDDMPQLAVCAAVIVVCISILLVARTVASCSGGMSLGAEGGVQRGEGEREGEGEASFNGRLAEDEEGEKGEEEDEAGVSILLSSPVSQCNASISSSSSSSSSSCRSSALVLSSDIVESPAASSLGVVNRRYSHTATSTEGRQQHAPSRAQMRRTR